MADIIKDININDLLQLFGMIAIIGGGMKYLVSLLDPFRKLKSEVGAIKDYLTKDKQRLDEGDEKMKAIDKKIEKQDKALAVIGLAVSEMINHQITGNDVDALKKRQSELDEFFYNNGKE